MYWNTVTDNTASLSDGQYYADFANMQPTTPEGYRCDFLAPSPVLFAGSCDMSGPITDPSLVWSRVLHSKLQQVMDPFPYIGLSRIHTGVMALLRRLSAYCVKYGPPKKLFIVLPRPVCMEIPIRGTLINVTERSNYVDYLLKLSLLTPDEHARCMTAVTFARAQQDCVEYQTYQFEQAATFLRVICERYHIGMRWTPNLSATAVDYYNRWLEIFLRQVPYMANTCVGVGELKDFATKDDGSTGLLTQASIARVMQDSSGQGELECIKAQLQRNQEFLMNNEPGHYARVIGQAERKVK